MPDQEPEASNVELEVTLNTFAVPEHNEEDECFVRNLRRLERLNLVLGVIALFLVFLIV